MQNSGPTIDRDRIDRQEPSIPRAPQPSPVPPSQPASVADPAGASGAVTLARVRYAGSSLPRSVLDAAVAPFLGRRLTRETLQGIANAVSGLYGRSDIALYSVSVPRQVITGGELLVQVVEGRIGTYALRKKTRSTPTALLHAHLDRLMRDRPTHRSRLERTLSLLRDIPGQTVDAQLRTTARHDEVLLDLDVKRRQVDVALEVDNKGVVNVVSGVQAQLSVGIHGTLREGDSTRFSAYLPVHPDRYQFYALSHTTPLDANGTTLGLSAAHVRTRTRGTEIRGEATQAGVTVSHALIRSFRRNLSLALSLDGINSDNYFLDTAFGGFRTRVVRLSAGWSSIGKRGGYAVSATLSQGLDAFGARPFVGYSEAGFAKANLVFTGVRELGRTTTVKVTARGQYSNDKLPTTERFALGGEGAGVAFRVGEITAERALAGSVELSWRAPGTAPAKRPEGGVTVFAYADGALAHSIGRPHFDLPARDHSLVSAGAGLRLGLAKWTLTAQIAVPLKKPSRFIEAKRRFLFGISRAV